MSRLKDCKNCDKCGQIYDSCNDCYSCDNCYSSFCPDCEDMIKKYMKDGENYGCKFCKGLSGVELNKYKFKEVKKLQKEFYDKIIQIINSDETEENKAKKIGSKARIYYDKCKIHGLY